MRLVKTYTDEKVRGEGEIIEKMSVVKELLCRANIV